MLKTCTRCSSVKEENEFTKCTITSSGYRSYCKSCNNEYYAKRRIEKYDQVREYERKFHKQRRLKHTYGITEDELNLLYKKQGNKCAICNTNTKLVIDHCHTTGLVRGLLCSPCNIGLGHYNDDVSRLENAIKYLNKTNETKD
jgi:hypothetical protein